MMSGTNVCWSNNKPRLLSTPLGIPCERCGSDDWHPSWKDSRLHDCVNCGHFQQIVITQAWHPGEPIPSDLWGHIVKAQGRSWAEQFKHPIPQEAVEIAKLLSGGPTRLPDCNGEATITIEEIEEPFPEYVI
jgi:ribosomal protein L37E